MNNYAISSCLLSESISNKKIITSILHKISDEDTPYKVVVDNKGVIIDLYEKIASDNNVHIASWLTLLAKSPKQIEYLEIDLNPNQPEITIFLEAASKIKNDKRIIVCSHNSIPDEFPYISNNNELEYNSNIIKVFNSNEAMKELNPLKDSITNYTINNEMKNKFKNIKNSNITNGDDNISSVKNKYLTKENIIKTVVLGILASLIAAWLYEKL